MDKQEKVIKGLECCIIHVNCAADGGCPYRSQGYENCLDTAIKDALALLKAQEPVMPILSNGSRYIYCGNCKYPLCKTSDDNIPTYCEECGRKVKWDG